MTARNPRFNRRTFMAGSAAAGLGAAAFLAGCGGEDETPGGSATPAGTSAGTGTPSATSETGASEPKRGGTIVISDRDAPNLDPMTNAVVSVQALFTYSRLFAPEISEPDANGLLSTRLQGDAAESWEPNEDATTWTITLRDNVKFHPPLNRPLVSDDVVFSWKRYTGRLPEFPPSPNAATLEVIEDIEVVNDRTMIFHLSRPFGSLPGLLAAFRGMVLFPQEAYTAFDPASEMVGSGPWIFESYTPGGSMKWHRNPEWHFGPDKPYLDAIEMVMSDDRTFRHTQFLGGNLALNTVNGLEFGEVTTRIPDAQFYTELGTLVGWYAMSDVSDPNNPAPWTDRRVRQALSMALDRTSMVRAAYNLDLFSQSGLEVNAPWQGILPGIYGEYVVWPEQEADIKPLFEYNPDGARALLAEAGFGDGFNMTVYDTTNYGPEHNTLAELALAHWSDIGVNAEYQIVDYRSDWIPNYYQSGIEGKMQGDHGLAQAGQSLAEDPGVFIDTAWRPGSAINQSRVDDPKVEEALGRYYAEPDEDTRISILRDLQKHLLNEMYYIPSMWGAQPSVVAVQPWLRGPLTARSVGSGTGWNGAHWWIED